MRRSLLAVAVALVAIAPAAFAQSSGVNKDNMDTSCQPCKDFYRYANGHWLDNAVMPPSYMVIGSGREVADRNQEVVHSVLDKCAANAATEKDPTLKKVGVMYSVLMDSTRSDREGAAPLDGELKRIDAIQTPKDLCAYFAHTIELAAGFGIGGVGVPLHLFPEADPGQSSMNIARLFQGGLGLPEKSFYFRDDPKSESIRKEYVAHIGRMLQLLGSDADAATRNADAILKLETALAESSMSRLDMRDPHALYHKIHVSELATLCPAIDWPAYFTTAGVKSLAAPAAYVDVSQPAFVRRLGEEVGATPIETWRAYLRFHVARSAAPWLGQKFFDETFTFQATLTGQKAPQPRWKRASQTMDFAMGEAVGKAYVAVAFPPSSKARVKEMVDNLQATMRERIESRPWMSEATKKQAVGKLDKVLKKIGYPDKWRDYSKLEVDATAPAAELIRRAAQFEVRRQLAQIGKPVDRTEWGMTPPTVNAYYDPTVNEIVFPAGILQPPYFDPKADEASNYGAIGMVIGHEMTHGFDDEGRQYDADGNLKDWWTTEDAKKFTDKAQKVIDQYNGFVAVDTLHVNGKMTLGENIADIGGLTIAYYAWKRSLHGKPAPVIDGFTGEQRFFLGHAQGWRQLIRPELLRTATISNEHSPAVWRVNGPVSDMPEFYEAFGCKPGDALYRAEEDRPAIW
jgi:putative endopeptidase